MVPRVPEERDPGDFFDDSAVFEQPKIPIEAGVVDPDVSDLDQRKNIARGEIASVSRHHIQNRPPDGGVAHRWEPENTEIPFLNPFRRFLPKLFVR